MEWAVFAAFAVAALAGALGVVMSAKAVHSALFLVLTLFSMAVFFVLQEAQFLAAVQVIVYAGAIVILFLFVIMLLGVDEDEDILVEPLRGQRPLAAVAAVALVAGLVLMTSGLEPTGEANVRGAVFGPKANVNKVAESLFTDFLWPFEITSALLVIAVVGSIVLARRTPSSGLGERTETEPQP